MGLKRWLCVLSACTVAVGCTLAPANAADADIVHLEDLGWEQVDMSEIEHRVSQHKRPEAFYNAL